MNEERGWIQGKEKKLRKLWQSMYYRDISKLLIIFKNFANRLTQAMCTEGYTEHSDSLQVLITRD